MPEHLPAEQPGPAAIDLAHLSLPEGLVLRVPTFLPRPLDDNAPSPNRQAELRARSQENVAAGRSPYADVAIQTRGELSWVMWEHGWSGDSDPQGKERANLSHANLQGTDLRLVSLQQANLHQANLRGTNLSGATMFGANLQESILVDANLSNAHLDGVHANRANLLNAKLRGAQLSSADLSEAHLDQADMNGALLQMTKLRQASLYGVKLAGANLQWADLCQAHLIKSRLDNETNLTEIKLDARTHLRDVAWNGAPLSQVDWEQVPRLGDEIQARQARMQNGQNKDARSWLKDYQGAARAYRQLALVLKGQGITEAADRFTYRALIMQRKELWWQLRNRKVSKLGAYFFSLFLAVLTGYGFRLWRMIVAYVLLILVFAGAYWSLDLQRSQPFSYWQAIILSVTGFHGRVFSNPFNLSDPQIVVTALEAIVGLVIEGVFIAMLTQRFFNR